MFKKLRIKFIAITMVMVAVVMALAFSAVCAIEYQRSYSVVQTALSDAADQAISDQWRLGRSLGQNQGNGNRNFRFSQNKDSSSGSNTQEGTELPEGFEGFENLPLPDEWENIDESSTDESQQNAAPPFIGRRDGQPRASSSLIPVAVYVTDANGEARQVPQVTTASISDDVLSDAMELATKAENGYGTFTSLELHYYRTTDENGNAFYVFADTSYTDSWKTLGLMLAIVGLVTLIVFFVISLFYSRWALRPVREAWDSQKQFVADASHDLKTPLTVVLANTAILLKHPDHTIASESQWIESTQKEAESMQGLVNEMLELAQVEAGEKVEVEKERIDFSDLVDGETLLFDSVALERGCAFECDVEQDICIVGNVKQVEKLVSTLVENAFKYVDDGGSVEITLRHAGKLAHLEISNTGATIAPEDLPHIFDRFYRADKARTSGEGGFGLGLAIAREIARQHDGDITCASDTSKTTFTVTLPTD